jgi:uncharacterized cupredoxin-like copper-binding protein
MMTPVTPSLRRILLAAFAVATLALGYPAAAGADATACPKNTVTIGNQGQVISVPQRSQVCGDDPINDGLLGNLPVLGNLPGLSGIL